MILWFKKFIFKLKFWVKLLILSPGIVVHELAHTFFCIITRTKIYKIKLFQFSEIAGYVEHQQADNLISSFLISFGPLFLNTTVAFLLFQKFALNWYDLKSLFLLYLGISISLSAIPSNADGNSFGRYIKTKFKNNILWFFLFIFYPFVWILNLLNYLKKYKIDFIFTVIIFYFALIY